MPDDVSNISSSDEGGSFRDQELLDGLVTQQTIEEHQDPLVGQILQDNYLVLNKVAESETTVEFRGEHMSSNKIVALKQFKTFDQEFLEYVQREVVPLGRFKHENIVEVIDWFQTSEGQLFCVSDYVEGTSLRELIDKHGCIKRAESIARIVLQIFDALVCARKHKRFHEDLCADNIFLCYHNRRISAKVDFFGVQQENTESRPEQRNRGRALSTSPEELLGRKITYRSNIYSLGGIILEMITANASSEVAEEVEQDPYALLDKLPDLRPDLVRADLENIDQLKTILSQALERNPEYRYQTIEYFRDSFEKWASSVSPTVRSQVERRLQREGPAEEPSTERRSLLAQGRKDHIFRSAAPEARKPPPSAPTPLSAIEIKEDVPTREEVQHKAEKSFESFLEAEQQKKAKVRGLVLKLIAFLAIAIVLSVAVAALIMKITNR